MNKNGLNNLFSNAVTLYNDKNFRDAFTVCDTILKIDPNHSECLHMFGLLYMKSGNIDLAIKYISQADNFTPNNHLYNNSLGSAYLKKDMIVEAEKYLLKSIDLKPDFIKPYLDLAKLYKKKKDFIKAESYYRKALELKPNSIMALNNLGNILIENKSFDESILCFEKILKINPNQVETLLNIANLKEIQDKNDSAIQDYIKIIKINPNYTPAHLNLGKLYIKLNKIQSAIGSFNNALKLEPRNAEYLVQLAIAYYKNGDFNSTTKYCRKALQLNPNVQHASVYLGIILHIKGDVENALKFFLDELIISPDSADVHFATGKAYFDMKNYDKASQYYKNSIRLNPDNPQAHYGVIQIRQDLCDWTKRKEDETLFIELLEKQVEDKNHFSSIPILNLNFFQIPLDVHSKTAKYFANMYSSKVVDLKYKLDFKYNKSENNKLKIGYISPDFREHAVGLLIKDFFKQHNKSKYEIYCYSLLPDMPKDNVQLSIKDGCNYFTSFYNSSIEDAAKKINMDGINILIDFAGYTTYSQTEILALRPAPLQVQFLGYPNTMGAEFIDYIIADNIIITNDLEKIYSEKIIYIPQAFLYSPIEISNSLIKRSDYNLPEDSIVFCCFNRPNKIDPYTFDSWMNILRNVPKSVLWLSGTDKIIINNLYREAEQRGINSERIIFVKKLPLSDYMAMHSLADIFLDTFLYNAGSTAVFSLAAGLPILTYPGKTFTSRMGASILNSAGLTELICNSEKEFEEKAISFAKNPSELESLKKKLITNQKAAPLFNIKNFVGYLEKSYSKIWDTYKKGKNPKMINIK